MLKNGSPITLTRTFWKINLENIRSIWLWILEKNSYKIVCFVVVNVNYLLFSRTNNKFKKMKWFKANNDNICSCNQQYDSSRDINKNEPIKSSYHPCRYLWTSGSVKQFYIFFFLFFHLKTIEHLFLYKKKSAHIHLDVSYEENTFKQNWFPLKI